MIGPRVPVKAAPGDVGPVKRLLASVPERPFSAKILIISDDVDLAHYCSATSTNIVDECSDISDRDTDLVIGLQSERVWRHNSSSGQKKTAIRKTIVAIQELDERARIALHGVKRG